MEHVFQYSFSFWCHQFTRRIHRLFESFCVRVKLNHFHLCRILFLPALSHRIQYQTALIRIMRWSYVWITLCGKSWENNKGVFNLYSHRSVYSREEQVNNTYNCTLILLYVVFIFPHAIRFFLSSLSSQVNYVFGFIFIDFIEVCDR